MLTGLIRWRELLHCPQTRNVQRSGDIRDNYSLYAHLPNSSTEECEKYRHRKTLPRSLHKVQKDFATKTLTRVRKNCTDLVPRYAAIARQLNVVKRTCRGTEFCMALLARKKVKYDSESTLTLCSKKTQCVFVRNIILGAGSGFTCSERYSFWQLKAKNLSPSGHAWYSPVTQFALKNETKQTDTT